MHRIVGMWTIDKPSQWFSCLLSYNSLDDNPVNRIANFPLNSVTYLTRYLENCAFAAADVCLFCSKAARSKRLTSSKA